ncbi:MAG: DUF3108 domain-containing protein [Balneola sp.]|jgi:hypothetical protein
MKYISLLILGYFFLSPNIFGQHSYPDNSADQPGMGDLFSVKETFKYEVKYGFFKLGWVEVELLSDTLYNGTLNKHLVTTIRSNSRIPLVGTELDLFHSLFFVNENGIPVSSYYWKDNADEDKFKEIVYEFDRVEDVVRYKEEDDTRDTLELVEPATSGQEIFYFSRLFAGSDKNSRLPVYVTKKLGYINMTNSSEIEMRNYAPFDDEVRTYLSEGTTENIDGPFGFSGEFRAWFLADDLRVPLEARVKVLFGNTIVRLIEYSRKDL